MLYILLWSAYSLEDPIKFTVHVKIYLLRGGFCLDMANLKPKYDIQQHFLFYFILILFFLDQKVKT